MAMPEFMLSEKVLIGKVLSQKHFGDLVSAHYEWVSSKIYFSIWNIFGVLAKSFLMQQVTLSWFSIYISWIRHLQDLGVKQCNNIYLQLCRNTKIIRVTALVNCPGNLTEGMHWGNACSGLQGFPMELIITPIVCVVDHETMLVKPDMTVKQV